MVNLEQEVQASHERSSTFAGRTREEKMGRPRSASSHSSRAVGRPVSHASPDDALPARVLDLENENLQGKVAELARRLRLVTEFVEGRLGHGWLLQWKGVTAEYPQGWFLGPKPRTSLRGRV